MSREPRAGNAARTSLVSLLALLRLMAQGSRLKAILACTLLTEEGLHGQRAFTNANHRGGPPPRHVGAPAVRRRRRGRRARGARRGDAGRRAARLLARGPGGARPA